MTTITMNISLSDSMKAFIDERLSSDKYPTASEYVRDLLVDEVGVDESHPLASMMEVIGVLIEKYEDEDVPELGIAE